MIFDLKRSIDLRWLLMFGAIFILRWSCFRKKWNLVPTICGPTFSSEFSNKNIFLGTAHKHTLMGSSSRLEQIRTFSEFKNGWFPLSYHFVPNIFYQIFVAHPNYETNLASPTASQFSSHAPFKTFLNSYLKYIQFRCKSRTKQNFYPTHC